MILSLLACVAMRSPSFQDAQTPSETYTNSKLGLSFAHPTTWILEKSNDRKSKKHTKVDNDTVHFRIPLTGAVEDAELIITPADFSGSKETWQKIQSDTNTDLKRTVERQWDQEILGVPMLLTRISYTEKNDPKTTVTGLLYNDSASKLLFRLTGPTSDFDKAQFQFTEAMQSLRTTNNKLPNAEDPEHPAAVVHPPDRGTKHTLYAPPAPPKPLLAPVAIPVVFSTKNVVLRVPKGWTATQVEGNALILHCNQLSFTLSVHLYSVLDSDSPNDALQKATAASLANFGTVLIRHDTPIQANDAGCVVTSVYREGTNEKGPLYSYEALGKSGDFYFVASGAPKGGDKEKLEDQKKVLQKLLDVITIETVS